MKCPRCRRPVDHEAHRCYSCGYSEQDASREYGANYVGLQRIHDAAHCLRKQDRDELAKMLDQLEIQFPQMMFCAYLGQLPENLAIAELGFWLLNHGEVAGGDGARPNENGVLLVMDVASRQIGLSLGYFAEALISEQDAYRALCYARPDLLEGDYGAGLAKVFRQLGRVLQKQGRRWLREQKKAAVLAQKAAKVLTPASFATIEDDAAVYGSHDLEDVRRSA